MLSPLLAYLKHISLGQTGKVSGENQNIFLRDVNESKKAGLHKADRPLSVGCTE